MAASREQDVFVLADRELDRVVGQIGADQWELPVPADVSGRPDRETTLRELVATHAYDDAWVPDLVAGRSMEEVGADAYDGDLLGGDPAAAFTAIVDRACSAVLEADDLDRVAHCSFGDFPVREYLWQVTCFRGLRAWEIAGLVGADRTLPADLVSGMWAELAPVADQWREIGVFGPAVPVPADADLQDRLLGLTGRSPAQVRRTPLTARDGGGGPDRRPPGRAASAAGSSDG